MASASKAHLKFRLMFWLTLVNLAACAAFATNAYVSEKALLLGGLDAKLRAAAEALPLLLPADFHARASGPGSIDRGAYSQALQTLTKYARAADVHYVYSFVSNADRTSWHTASTSLSQRDLDSAKLQLADVLKPGWQVPEGEAAGRIPQFWQPYDAPAGMLAAAKAGQPSVFQERDEFGDWRSYNLPIALPDGRMVLAGADVDVAFVDAALTRSLLDALGIALASFVLVSAICWFIANTIAREIGAVAQETGRISQFQLDQGTLARSTIAEVDQLISAVEDMKASLRSFGKYVPTALVRELITTGQEAKLGGQEAELTVFFSDIADFTRISEQLRPAELVAHVGDYLGEMSELVLANQGTVDKYIGDAVMAFWGAPTPVANHPLQACRTALACQQRLAELRIKWLAEGKPDLFTRIGLHTGEMIVGNMGSHNRLNYTVIGDAVNLASRLEGLNKYYGTAILISQVTWLRVQDQLLARPVDCVAVKGKRQGLVIYELLADRAAATPQQVALAESAEAAMTAYLARNFTKAEQAFAQVLAQQPGDLAAQTLQKRCAAFVQTPPPADWDGSYQMVSK